MHTRTFHEARAHYFGFLHCCYTAGVTVAVAAATSVARSLTNDKWWPKPIANDIVAIFIHADATFFFLNILIASIQICAHFRAQANMKSTSRLILAMCCIYI